MRVNKSRYAVLGALTIKPMSGYDLRGFFEQSVSFFWTESYGQIYPILKQLQAEGMATTAEAREGSTHPRRTVYAITPRGRDALAAWLREPAEHQVGRTEILLKLFFAGQGDPADARRLIAEFRGFHAARLAEFGEVEASLRREHGTRTELPSWLVTLSYGQHVSRALLAWCDEAEQTLGAQQTERGLSAGDYSASSGEQKRGKPG